MFEFRLDYYVFAVVLLYIPFHLLEEALGNFPLWMKEHGYTPVKKTYGFWMAGNIFFFYPLLVGCALIYHFIGDHAIVLGLSVFLWGIVNFSEHLFFTIKDRKISPGLFTGIVFVLVGVSGIYKVHTMGLLSIGVVVLAVVIALFCIIIPAPLQKYIGNRLWKNFD